MKFREMNRKWRKAASQFSHTAHVSFWRKMAYYFNHQGARLQRRETARTDGVLSFAGEGSSEFAVQE